MHNVLSYIKNHRLLAGVIGYIVLMIVIVIVIIVVNSNNSKYDPIHGDAYRTEENVQPEDAAFDPNKTTLLGFDELYSTHSNSWLTAIGAVVTLYSRENNLEVNKVNLVEGSYQNTSSRDSASESMLLSLGQGTTVGLNVTGITSGMLYSLTQDSQTVFEKNVSLSGRYVIVDGFLPSWLNRGPDFRSTFSDGVPEFANGVNLPPLLPTDSVRAYFGCPLPNQTTADGCYIYKYDFYY